MVKPCERRQDGQQSCSEEWKYNLVENEVVALFQQRFGRIVERGTFEGASAGCHAGIMPHGAPRRNPEGHGSRVSAWGGAQRVKNGRNTGKWEKMRKIRWFMDFLKYSENSRVLAENIQKWGKNSKNS